MGDILGHVRSAAHRRILFLPHAIRQMSRSEQVITPKEVTGVVLEGEVIEDYPEDPRGNSCLMLGTPAASRPLHVVCSPKTDFLAVITACLPEADRWSTDFRRRLR